MKKSSGKKIKSFTAFKIKRLVFLISHMLFFNKITLKSAQFNQTVTKNVDNRIDLRVLVATENKLFSEQLKFIVFYQC